MNTLCLPSKSFPIMYTYIHACTLHFGQKKLRSFVASSIFYAILCVMCKFAALVCYHNCGMKIHVYTQGAKNEEEASKKDLRSRGLCLVPVSCTSHFGGDNAADYWAPAPLGGILR
jgi:hypothetical protein